MLREELKRISDETISVELISQPGAVLYQKRSMTQKRGPDLFLVGSAPMMKVLHLPRSLHLLTLHLEHSSLRVIFLVCLAFLRKMGLV